MFVCVCDFFFLHSSIHPSMSRDGCFFLLAIENTANEHESAHISLKVRKVFLWHLIVLVFFFFHIRDGGTATHRER